MDFFTVAEIAEMWKLSESQIYALIDSGRLRCHRFTTKKNGAVRVSQAQIDVYLRETESGQADPVQEPPKPQKLTLQHIDLNR